MKTKLNNKMKQVVARVPEEVHKALKLRAAEEGRSVSVIVEGLIRGYLVKISAPQRLSSTERLLRHIKETSKRGKA